MKKFRVLFLSMILVLAIVSPALAKGHQSTSAASGKYYSVLFKTNQIPANFSKQMAKHGAKVVYSVPEIGFVQVQAPESSYSDISQLDSVQRINPSISWNLPNTKAIPLSSDLTTDLQAKGTEEEGTQVDPQSAAFWNKQWDIQQITHNGESYNLGTGSHHVVVGIIDTGIDPDHPAIEANLLPGSKNFVPAGGFQGTELNETGGPNDIEDKQGHGTHVAGSIAGHGAILGVAPNIGIRSYRVFGTSSAESAWIFKAMIAAANDGVDVISMSLGGYDILGQAFYTDPETGKKYNLGNDVADFVAYKRVVDYVRSKGSLVVMAAGNEGLNATKKGQVTDFLNQQYGGNGLRFVGAGFEVGGLLPGVVTVSATGPDNQLALYSNYGPGFIDIAAPGGDERLAMSMDWNEYVSQRLFEKEFCLSSYKNGGYVWMIGTSMATPKVSAVAALLVDKYGKMSPDKLEQLLFSKGVERVIGGEQAYFGNGFLDAVYALQ